MDFDCGAGWRTEFRSFCFWCRFHKMDSGRANWGCPFSEGTGLTWLGYVFLGGAKSDGLPDGILLVGRLPGGRW